MTAALKNRNLTTTVQSPPRFEIVDVTPTMAEEWLGRNDRNRPFKKVKIGQFVGALLRGEWAMTGEGIKFDTNGRLLDGQNRLAAVVQSGVTMRTTVIYGLQPAAQDNMDTGSARTSGDQLAIHGYKSPAAVGAAARLLILFKSDRFYVDRTEQQVTHAEILEFAQGNQLLVESVDRGMVMKQIAQPSPLSAACYLTAEIDADASVEFFTRVNDGVNLGTDSPILAVRSRLYQARLDRVSVRPIPQMSLVIRGWNAWRRGESMHHINYTSRSGQIPCPQPI